MQHVPTTTNHLRRHMLRTGLAVLIACLCILIAATAFAQNSISPVSPFEMNRFTQQNAEAAADQITKQEEEQANVQASEQAKKQTDEQQMPVLAVPEDRGLMYGLLSGTLIGSLVYGEPFSGIGVADILLLMVIVSVVLKFVRGRITVTPTNYRQTPPVDINAYRKQRNGTSEAEPREHAEPSPKPRSRVDIPEDEPNPQLYERAAGMWDHLKGNDTKPASNASGQTARKRSDGFTDAPKAFRDDQPLTVKDAYQSGAKVVVPDSFDTDDFLKGAKMVFARLQHSWDTRDMDDIAQFTTPEVHEEIKKQALQDPTPSSSELLLVNARMLEVKQDENGLLATVFFDVLMRENRQGAQTEQVREIWHFLKSDEYAGIWRLDGIEHISA